MLSRADILSVSEVEKGALMAPEQSHYDAIVVGTGPGGATVARELAKQSRRILILEWGAKNPVTGGLGQTLAELGRPGRSFLLTNGFVGLVRGITTGGSSIYYYGTAFEPPFEVFDSYGIDLRGAIAEARAELPIAPLNEKLIGPRASRIMQSARDLGLDWAPLPKFIYQDRCPEGEWLGFYSAPTYESKWNSRMWVEEAITDGATLVTGARVERVLIQDGTATGVEYTAGRGKQSAHGDTVVLAAGGIGTPVILRASEIPEAGRDFFFDPMIAVMGRLGSGELADRGPEFPMAGGMLLDEAGYMITDMAVQRELYMLMAAQRMRFDRLGAHGQTLQIMVKVHDELGGRLTGRGGVRKPLSDSDRAKFRHGFDLAKRILENAGARDVFRSMPIASHPGATAKIGEVVDADLQTTYENLYVCDCSVIPEAWGRPPTLTLIGLGKRLAAHLVAASPTRPG